MGSHRRSLVVEVSPPRRSRVSPMSWGRFVTDVPRHDTSSTEPSGLILERMFDCDMPVVDAQPIVSDQSRLKECHGSFGTDSSAVGGGLSAEARHLQGV